ncbi:acyl-CoA dehydrogenase family protein [Elongatibacter sediminis]|uniref:Acyl-CoA dehydrogenase family protein n=1 Tax=Elongatibacter sediminis TaxID=3119006 RepID=A0AAW9REG6_9GAMM
MTELDEFRAEARDWLATHCPESMRTPYRTEADLCWGGRHYAFQSDDQERWLRAMADRGWTAPTWPAEYGGGGLDREHAKILQEEMNRISARPPLYSFGISMIGPALLHYGSEELKQQHLPPIVRGEIRWAQGYSEPNAGSDLASLQARLEDRGDHFILNGSKIWTSYGDKGDWMFCLVRSDSEAPRHAGISLVLFDMATPGVSTRPIRLISGKSPFTETFFEDVRVEKNQVVGELNAGWTVAKYLLTHEREMIGTFGIEPSGAEPLRAMAVRAIGLDGERLADPSLRNDIAWLEIDTAALDLTMERARDEVKAGASLGARSSLFKYCGTELNMRRQELIMAIHGAHALDWDGADTADGQIPRTWLRSRGNAIEGGTSEIQLNIVAKHMLGLPG